MGNASNNYFDIITGMTGILDDTARYFNNALTSFNINNLPKIREELENFCALSAEKKKSAENGLYKDFITPIEREDIMNIITSTERATCCFSETFSRIYIYNVSKIKENVYEFSDLSAQVSAKLKKFSLGFEKFRKTQNLYKKAESISELAREREKIYIEAMRKLVKESSNTDEIFVWSQIYNGLKKNCFLCGQAADEFGRAILKNI